MSAPRETVTAVATYAEPGDTIQADGYVWDWHCHHDILLERRTMRRGVRLSHIETKKDDVALRQRLYRSVRGDLASAAPVEWVESDRLRVESNRLRAESVYLWAESARLRAKSVRLRAEAPEILALHAAECPGCPWDGRSIFPEPTP